MFRALLTIVVIAWCAVTSADDPVKLWNPEAPFPKSAEAPWAKGVEFRVIKARQPEVDGFNWLHGVALAWHKNKLYASFGLNAGRENTASEVVGFQSSGDEGKTWSKVEIIDSGTAADDHAVSHGVFLPQEGKLWAFMGSFYGRMQRVHMRAYLLDDDTGKWQALGDVGANDFWPMQEPLLMDDGNYIIAGLSTKPGHPAAVAISHGKDLQRWDVITIKNNQPRPKMWGESTVIVDGPHVTNIARFGEKALALVSESSDYGRTWKPMAESNLRMATTKPYAGTLSTGQRYLVCNTTSDVTGRAPLTIAVSRPGERSFSRVYKLRDAEHQGPGESHPQARLSYPYAVEREGKLYVGFSNCGGRDANLNSAELAIVPTASLKAD